MSTLASIDGPAGRTSFAAVTLRIYIPLSVIAGVEFFTAHSAIAWLCWVPSLIVAEWRFNHVPSTLPRGTAPVGS